MISITNPTPKLKQPFTSNTAPRTLSLLFSPISNSHQNPKISAPNTTNSIKRKTHLVKPLISPNQHPKPFPVTPLKSDGGGSSSNQSLHVADRKLLGLDFGSRALDASHGWHSTSTWPKTLTCTPPPYSWCSTQLTCPWWPNLCMVSSLILFTLVMHIDYLTYPLEILSWGMLALMPVTCGTLPTQMACILLSNLGASFTEVASDALVAEFSKKQKVGERQSYAFMALAAGGILGNPSGGFFLQRTQQPKIMFLIFSLLSFQLVASLTTRENSIDSPQMLDHHLIDSSISGNLRKKFTELSIAIGEERILRTLPWVVASIAVVPMLSGTIFCYQTQCLKIDPSIIGMSKVIGQLMVLSATVAYNRYLKQFPMQNLVCWMQITYAFSILSDIFLVKQFNVKLGISNEAYILCMSALAEAVAQFKLLPFSVLFANLCPLGCEGSLIAFLASALCLSSIFSGFLGIGLANLIWISPEDYSKLPLGVLLQFLAALAPMAWISHIPVSQAVEKMKRRIKRSRRKVLLPSGNEEK